MPHGPAAADLPPNLLCYEELLDAGVDDLANFAWPELDENSPAGLCYTSGTTGNPKVRIFLLPDSSGGTCPCGNQLPLLFF
jgi:acyl-CoA synthetase (AMP-forming)/AMP-acid ligase II